MKRFVYFSFFLLALTPVFADGSKVTVKKNKEGWQLLVDGQPMFIKGVGCNVAVGAKNEDYLAMAKEMGANSVRTWGQTPEEYFDKAQKLGIKVDAGIWFNPIRGPMTESYQDAATCKELKEKTLAIVTKMKNHPALLMWNLGNEVFNFTESEAERKAFGHFLRDLIKAVKKVDPNHPIVYACAGVKDFEGLKAYVPNVDIVGINTYGGFPSMVRWLKNNHLKQPVIATEYGPAGEWAQKKDGNQQPFDPYDQYKAGDYAERWREIEQHKEVCLGGYAFVLGEQRNQGSLTYWNLNFGDKKREGFWTLAALYKGQTPVRTCPRITILKVDEVENLPPGSEIFIDVSATSPADKPLRYSYFVTDIATDMLTMAPAHYLPVTVAALAPGGARLRVPREPGTYRVYVMVDDKRGNAALASRSISVTKTAP